MVGLLSAGCLFWLEKLQPLFLVLAVGSLVYQIWAVFRRPRAMRTLGMKAILGVSLLFNGLLLAGWVVLTIRYQ
jgi:hypothetical protein